MGGRWVSKLILLAALLAAGFAGPTEAQSVTEGYLLHERGLRLLDEGKYADAETALKRALEIYEKAQPAGHPDIGRGLVGLALALEAQERLSEAERLLKRALDIFEVSLSAHDPDLGACLSALAVVYHSLGRYGDAEPILKRLLELNEQSSPTNAVNIGVGLNNLANLYRDQGRFGEAEPLMKRAIDLFAKASPDADEHVANGLNNLAGLYHAQARYDEAEPLLRRALDLRQKTLPGGHPLIGRALNNLGFVLQAQGRHVEAEPFLKAALEVYEKALPTGHPDLARTLNNLATAYQAQGRFPEAEQLFKQVLHSLEAVRPADHPEIARSLDSLAGFYFVQSDWARAADLWRRSTSITVRRVKRDTNNLSQAMVGSSKSEPELLGSRFSGLVKAVHRFGISGKITDPNLAREMFEVAQWARGSEASTSLAQMAVRGAMGDAKLAALVRERQDLVQDWQKKDKVRTSALAMPPETRNRNAEDANATHLTALEKRIAEIDGRMRADFPDYAALARPTPLSVQEVQAQLGANEVLILYLDTAKVQPTLEETFIWAVTKTDMRWVRSDIGTLGLQREVAALRCGLDAGLWDDDAASARCRDLLKAEPERDAYGNVRSETLPFARDRALDLYKTLFGQVEDLIRDKHLLIVPSGPLTQLPFQVLVTAPHSDGDYRATKWLARQNAITVLPAVSSLKALRRVAKTSSASKPMLGIGNPLLDGNPAERPWEAKWAQLARDKQACPQTMWQRMVGLVEKRRSVQRVAMRGGHADLDHLRSQVPLHDTADELCAVAKELRLTPDDMLLGARATETALKKLSSDGKLASYRVVHFATHGTVAGEIEGTSEPGLILTPPKDQTDLDDGYLSASEVAALKLDAEWVILSACNTAAGGAQGAEALSGLARAFIYAGARALLASHWSVSSEATVSLITSAVGAISRDKKLGRSEALRRAMLAMIDKGKPHEAHPAYWGPFVVVGEGAAANR